MLPAENRSGCDRRPAIRTIQVKFEIRQGVTRVTLGTGWPWARGEGVRRAQ